MPMINILIIEAIHHLLDTLNYVRKKSMRWRKVINVI